MAFAHDPISSSPLEWRGRVIGGSFIFGFDEPLVHLTNAKERSYLYWDPRADEWLPFRHWTPYLSSVFPLVIIRSYRYPEHCCLGMSGLIRQCYGPGELIPEKYRVGEQPVIDKDCVDQWQ